MTTAARTPLVPTSTTRTLTAAAVERIRAPATGQADHFDQGYPGLALRVSYGGAKAWVYFYRLYGKQKRLTLGPTEFVTKSRMSIEEFEARVANLLFEREALSTATAPCADREAPPLPLS